MEAFGYTDWKMRIECLWQRRPLPATGMPALTMKCIVDCPGHPKAQSPHPCSEFRSWTSSRILYSKMRGKNLQPDSQSGRPCMNIAASAVHDLQPMTHIQKLGSSVLKRIFLDRPCLDNSLKLVDKGWASAWPGIRGPASSSQHCQSTAARARMAPRHPARSQVCRDGGLPASGGFVLTNPEKGNRLG